MQATHPSGSNAKATTASHHLLATAIVGAALIGYLVQKTPDARARLALVASQADLTGSDAAFIANQLTRADRLNTALEV